MRYPQNLPVGRINFGISVNAQDMIYALFALPMLCFLLYGSHLPIPYFADDFGLVFEKPWSKLWYFFNHMAPHGVFYRPIEASLLALVQAVWGMNTYPIHLIQITMHSLLCGFVYWTILYLGFSKTKAIIGSLFLVVSQANVMAVLSNDTVSQVMGTVFGFTSIFLLYYTLMNRPPSSDQNKLINPYITYWLSVVALTIALLSKESSMSFLVLILGMVAYYHLMKEQRLLAALRKVCIISLPYLFVTIGYLILRSRFVYSQPSWGSGIYNFNFGWNIIENLGRLIFASATPVSTATIFSAWVEGNLLFVTCIALITMTLLLCVASLLWRNPKKKLLVGVLISGCIGFFPVFLLNHVSELHVYNAMPFFSILFGVAVGSLIERNRSKPFAKWAICGALVIFLVSHVIAINSKAFLMKANGERAQAILAQIEPYTNLVPLGGKLCLVNPPTQGVEYSVFYMNGFDVIEHDGKRRIYQLAGRNDFSIQILDSSFMTIAIHRSCLTLTMLGNKVIKWNGKVESLSRNIFNGLA